MIQWCVDVFINYMVPFRCTGAFHFRTECRQCLNGSVYLREKGIMFYFFFRYHHYKEHVVSHLQKSMNTTLDCCLCNFRPDFFTLYLDEPDTSGHRYGPASSQVSHSLNIRPATISWLLINLKDRQNKWVWSTFASSWPFDIVVRVSAQGLLTSFFQSLQSHFTEFESSLLSSHTKCEPLLWCDNRRSHEGLRIVKNIHLLMMIMRCSCKIWKKPVKIILVKCCLWSCVIYD